MRSSYNPNYVNASLLHELRMILTGVFAGRASSGPRLRAVQDSSLKCNVCLGVKNKPQDAITIANGQAVCMEHRGV